MSASKNWSEEKKTAIISCNLNTKSNWDKKIDKGDELI